MNDKKKMYKKSELKCDDNIVKSQRKELFPYKKRNNNVIVSNLMCYFL